jgi:acyl carrier protein
MSTGKSELDSGSGSGSDDVTRKITAILADLLEIDAGGIKPETKLEEDLGADSLLYLELFEELKDEFDLDIEMNSIQRYAAKHRVSTVGEIANMVRRYQTEGQAMLGEVKSEPAG